MYFRDTYLILNLEGMDKEEEGISTSITDGSLWLRCTVQLIPYLGRCFPRMSGYSHVERRDRDYDATRV
jgi:hypothetical protein